MGSAALREVSSEELVGRMSVSQAILPNPWTNDASFRTTIPRRKSVSFQTEKSLKRIESTKQCVSLSFSLFPYEAWKCCHFKNDCVWISSLAPMHATCAGFSYSTRIFHHKNAKRNKTEWLTVVFVYKHQHAHTRTYLTLSLLHVSIFNLARILKWQINLHGCCWGTAPFASFLLILLSPKIHKSQISRFHSKSIALHACCIRQSL